MSMPDEEARALDYAHDFLSHLGSGEYKVASIRQLRADARMVLRHYPLAAGQRWLDSHP